MNSGFAIPAPRTRTRESGTPHLHALDSLAAPANAVFGDFHQDTGLGEFGTEGV